MVWEMIYMYKGRCILVTREEKKIFKFDIPQNPRHKLKNDNLLLLYIHLLMNKGIWKIWFMLKEFSFGINNIKIRVYGLWCEYWAFYLK